jgi:Cys/Met metabolism PLP-dependent enzyme
MSPQLRLETLAVHAGWGIDQASGAVVAAIVPSVTFQRDAEGHYPLGYFYGSKGNPNRNSLEAAFAALEGGVTAVAFASGCAVSRKVLETRSSRVALVALIFQRLPNGYQPFSHRKSENFISPFCSFLVAFCSSLTQPDRISLPRRVQGG